MTQNLGRMTTIVPAVLLLVALSARQSSAAPYSFSVTDRMIYAPALVADELGYWKDRDIDIRVGMVADDEALFDGVRNRFRSAGRHAIDFGACRLGDLAYQRALGLAIEPIAVIAVNQGRTRLIARGDNVAAVDLKGRRIACDLETAHLKFLSDTLARAELSLGDVQIVDQHGTNNPRAFVQGQVDAIVIDAAGASECLDAGGHVLVSTNDHPMLHVLFVKSWVKDGSPDLIEKFLIGYQKAQSWMRDDANAERLSRIIDRRFYWEKYQSDAQPLGTDFIRSRLDGYRLHPSIDVNDALRQRMQEVDAFFVDRALRLRTGDLRLSQIRPTAAKTLTALDNAAAWWRFFEPNDFLNHGSAGKTLDLVARGDNTNPTLWGVDTRDYYHRDPTWMFQGVQNDGYGWACDGVAKYLTTKEPNSGADLLAGDFTIWMRCSNRNTKNTRLFGHGQHDGQQGISIEYHTAESKPSIVCRVHGESDNEESGNVLRLAELPFQTFLDVAFSYSSPDRRLRGVAYETQSGKVAATGEAVLPVNAYRTATGPLTLGGEVNEQINVPLHGAIENAAVWTRVLTDDEIASLTVRQVSNQPASVTTQEAVGQADNLPARRTTLWHNVRDFGARGDGRHDDTDAIQAAIEACVVPVTIRDPRSGRWHGLPDSPPRPGHRYSGTVFIPPGVYRTTRPIVVRSDVQVIGDESSKPLIASRADAGVVFWNGDWRDRRIDFKVRSGVRRRTTGVTLENLVVRAGRFGLHTMGVPANGLRMKNCRWEGSEAGFVCTGFMMFSAISDCQFEPSFWMLTRQGTRFNTSTINRCTIGLHGTEFKDWAMRLEGCIQCVRISEITFEVRSRGLYLDSYAAGVTIDINNIWNFDAHRGGVPEVMRIVNGRGVSVRNVMALDAPSTFFVGKDVRHINLENIQAKSITIEDPNTTKPVLSNVPTTKLRGDGSVIEDDIGGVKATEKD